MRVHCPNCRQRVNVSISSPTEDVTCPVCGSLISTLDENATLAYVPDAPQMVSRFKLLELAGQGGYGNVWKARDEELDRVVAIKVARPEARSDGRILREGRAAAQLQHPHIVTVHEVGSYDGHVYIVSDYVEGISLRERLEEGPLDVRQAAQIALRVAEALEHAHQRKIIHRDVKPGNILLDRAGKPYLADFGLAKREASDQTITLEGKVLGTPAYMPPEQARGETKSIDARSDIYSLGATLYHMLTGRLPFMAGKRAMLWHALHEQPDAPRKLRPEIPRDLETIVLTCLEKSPQWRYQTAAALADDLRRFLAGDPIKARPVGVLERGWRWCRRYPARVAVLSVALIVLVGAALWPPESEAPRGVAIRPTASASGDSLAVTGPRVRKVRLETNPPGATVVLVPMDPETGWLRGEQKVQPRGKTPVTVSLSPGRYFVEVVVAAPYEGFHQVYRHVPSADDELPSIHNHQSWVLEGDILRLPAINIPRRKDVQASMVRIDGGEFVAGWVYAEHEGIRQFATPHVRRVADYYMDPREVSLGDGRRVLKPDDIPVPLRQLPPEDDGVPLTFVSFDEAMSYAEKVGKRLPDEFEYEYAATNRGQTFYPWGDDPLFIDGSQIRWRFGNVEDPESYDKTTAFDKPLYGLYSNATEWVDAVPLPFPGGPQLPFKVMSDADQVRYRRSVRGGPPELSRGNPRRQDTCQYGPRFRYGESISDRHPRLGFRCALSTQPKFLTGVRFAD